MPAVAAAIKHPYERNPFSSPYDQNQICREINLTKLTEAAKKLSERKHQWNWGAVQKRKKVVTIKKRISLKIGNKEIHVLPELKHIVEEIESSKYILSLKNGWDENKALIIPENVWQAAAFFLITYSTSILSSKKIIIKAPEINPCSNGTIDLSWRTRKARLLINIRIEDQNMIAYYYGDLYNNCAPIKGTFPLSKFWDHISSWMQNLK